MDSPDIDNGLYLQIYLSEHNKWTIIEIENNDTLKKWLSESTFLQMKC